MSPKSTSACSPSETKCEKPMPRAAGPVEHGGDQRARLRDEGQLAGQRVGVREAGVQPDVRRQQAEAVGPEDAQQVRPRGVEHGLLLRGVEPGGEHDRGARAARAELRRSARARVAGGVQITARSGASGRLGDVGVDRHAVELRVLRVDRPERAGEAAVAQVAPDRGADAGRALARRRSRPPSAGRTGESRLRMLMVDAGRDRSRRTHHARATARSVDRRL